MLSPVIMIGCGGSGSKAVRYARAAVTRRLREVGWTAEMPGAWTFLGLDFNKKQEDTTEIPPLPDNDFPKMSLQFSMYHELYDTLLNTHGPNSEKYRQHLLGWLPHRDTDVNLGHGAGKYRAVGRAAGLLALENQGIRATLSSAFGRARDPDCIDELREVSASLTGSGDGQPGDPIVLVCASMAGGTGAGVALDVVDLLRRIDPAGREPLLLLFANDIFGQGFKPHMAGNSIAILAELLSGYWNNDADSAGPGDFFAHHQGNPGHGPRAVFVVSSKGLRAAEIGEDTIAVYRAVGEALCGWATDSQVQTHLQSYVIGNANARASGNDSGYPFSVEQPGVVSSFGAAVVTVGRARFQRWAQDLLSRQVIETLKNGDRRPSLAGTSDAEDTESEQIKKMAEDYWRVIYGDEFPERVQLEEANWVGLASTEVVFLSGSTRTKRDEISNELESYIAGSRRMDAEDWLANLKAAYDYCVDGVKLKAENLPEENLRDWTASTVDHMSKTVSYVLARSSCAVAIQCINECDDFLRYRQDELNSAGVRDVETAEAKLNECRQRLRTTRGKLALDRHDSVVRNVFDATVELLVQEWYSARDSAVIGLYDLVLSELNAALLQSLEQVRRSVESVFEREPGSEPSEVLGWPAGIDEIPVQYRPSKIELPLELHTEWKSLLEDLCRQARTSSRQEELPMDAARILLVEGDETARVPPLIAVNPAGQGWRLGHGVEFSADAESAGVSDRVQSWLYDNFGEPLREGINAYLTPGRGHAGGASQIDYASRKSRFQECLNKAVNLAYPLMEVDENLCGLVYGGNAGLAVEIMCSPLPFSVNSPSLADARTIFDQHINDDIGNDLSLRNSDTSSILVSAFNTPLPPMVVKSITDPIAQHVQAYREGSTPELPLFKRARTLLHASAFPLDALKSMIRGFAIARLCGYITADVRRPIEITGPREPGDDREVVEFPWPFLSQVQKGTEVLPALLESHVQCYAEVSTKGLAAFEAYRRLFKLGDKGLALGDDRDYLDDVKELLSGCDLSYRCLDLGRASELAAVGNDINERRKAILAYLARNISYFERLEGADLTGRECRTESGYTAKNNKGEYIHDVALLEILPLARECYEELVRDIDNIGRADLEDPT